MRTHAGLMACVWLAAVGAILLPQPDSEARTTLESPQTGRSLALLIGIGDYDWFEPVGRSPKVDLKGPPNDLERMRLTLRRFGFEGEDNVRILSDEDASKAGIEDGFRWLADQVRDTSDVVVIYYSGHGSRAPDTDGDEAEVTSGDADDEALVPWDADDPTDPSQLVIDDEIRRWLADIRTRNVTVIIDACFSGTTTRGDQPGGARRRARGPEGGSAAGAQVDGLDDLEHTLITASSPTQTAKEDVFADDRTYGVFTYHLTRILDGASPNARYDDLLRQLASQLAQEGQTPQLEGDRGARLFKVHGDLPRRQYVRLTAIGGSRYAIDAGAVHGVRTSALYEVFGPEEIRFEAEPLGWFRVDSVAELASFGRMVSEADSPPVGARAVLAFVPSGVERVTTLGVFVHSDAAPVREAVDSIRFARITDSLRADAWVMRDGDAYRVFVEGIEIPPRTDDSGYSVAGLTGTDGYRGSSVALCQGLSRALSIKTFRAIENPEPPSGLRVQVQLVEEGSRPRESDMQADTAYIREKPRRYDVWAKVDAPETSVLYLTAAVVGYISAPARLYPRSAAEMNTPFDLNQWVPLRRSIPAKPPGGVEVISAVVSSDQFDFGSITDRLKDSCGDTRGPEEDEARAAKAVVGWTSIQRPIVFIDEPES